MAAFQFRSSYFAADTPCRWLRGTHHGHSTLSDGSDPPEEIIRAYEDRAYDYCALSEHDLFADPARFAAQTAMTLLPAVEVTSDKGQTLMFLGAGETIPPARTLTMAQIAAFVAGRDGLFVADHPNWIYRPQTRHASFEELLAVADLGAIEIYTGVIERLAGSPYATDIWDLLLSAGRRVFGHAVDDQHAACDRFLGWNCVQWRSGEQPTVRGIIEALRAGRFYASTGVEIRSIGLADDGRSIIVESDAERIRWIMRDGRLAHDQEGGAGCLSLDGFLDLERLRCPYTPIRSLADIAYVRVELVGRGGAMAWSQPFFVEAA